MIGKANYSNMAGDDQWITISTYGGYEPFNVRYDDLPERPKPSEYPYPFNGAIRWNTYKNSAEMFYVNEWKPVWNSSLEIGLTAKTRDVLQWAEKKMREEEDLENRRKKYPALDSAWNDFQTIDALCREEDGKSN